MIPMGCSVNQETYAEAWTMRNDASKQKEWFSGPELQ